jgi:SIT family siderophore-iron:H+ symporter-like MFS transporter
MAISRPHSRASSDSNSNASSEDADYIGHASPGVQRMQIIARDLTIKDRIFILVSLFLIAYVYGLESLLRPVYQVSRS